MTSLYDLRWRGQKSKKGQITTSNSKSVTMLTFDRHRKLSTVTSSSDLWLRGQRSKRGQISNKIKWQKQQCQRVGKGPASKKVYGDLYVWPMVRGQRWKKVKSQTTSNGISNSISTYQYQHLRQTSKIVHGDLYIQPLVKGSKVKERSNFKHTSKGKSSCVNVSWTHIKIFQRGHHHLSFG